MAGSLGAQTAQLRCQPRARPWRPQRRSLPAPRGLERQSGSRTLGFPERRYNRAVRRLVTTQLRRVGVKMPGAEARREPTNEQSTSIQMSARPPRSSKDLTRFRLGQDNSVGWGRSSRPPLDWLQTCSAPSSGYSFTFRACLFRLIMRPPCSLWAPSPQPHRPLAIFLSSFRPFSSIFPLHFHFFFASPILSLFPQEASRGFPEL